MGRGRSHCHANPKNCSLPHLRGTATYTAKGVDESKAQSRKTFPVWERFRSLDLVKGDSISECLDKAWALGKDVSKSTEGLLAWGLAVKNVLSHQSLSVCSSVSLHAKLET